MAAFEPGGGPCTAEIPWFADFQKKYEGAGLWFWPSPWTRTDGEWSVHLMAAPSTLLFWFLGASLGAIGGLLGASVLQFTCNRQDAVHLLVWHGGVVIVSLLLGVLVAWGVNGLVRPRA